MLTVDFDRLGLRAGDRVLDMGCGAGRHAFEMYRRGADVVAFDMDADELSGVLELFGAMKEAGEVPAGAEADIKQGDALALPFADGEFDRIVAAEVLEHIHADVDAIKFRVDDILDVHKNDPSLISDDLRKTTLKNAREAAHLLEKSLLRADAVESYGFTDIRAMRKGLVARVENLCGKLEPLTKE